MTTDPQQTETAAVPEAASSAAEDEALASPADAVIDSVTVSQQQALQTMESAGAAMFEGVARVQREIADFVSERIRQDMETQQELLRCKSLDEVRVLQARFFKTAMDQYSAEATRLMRLGGELMARSMDRHAG
jgi:hypothetical protein